MAIQHTLFISATRLKKDTALGESVDENIIMPYILLAQDMQILPVLGTDLYNKLKTDIQGSSLSGDYQTLVETYIQPALVQFAFMTLAPYLRLRFVNNAVVVMGATEQSSSATYDDIKPLMNTAEDAAQFYRQRLVDYLCDKGSAAFPEYASNNSPGDLSPTVRNYYAGLNLDVAYTSNKIKNIMQGADIKCYGI
tara:strand:+ start:17784 stop:18368 length:585 start_codon:yes stop_codon:yes gene_type:complete